MKRSALLLALISVVLSFAGCAESFPEYANDNSFSIDFMQPWAFCSKTYAELENHFYKLSLNGITTVIIQNLAQYDDGVPTVCYYKSDVDFKQSYPEFLQSVISAAQKYDIKIIAGVSSDSYWWKYGEHGYCEAAMETFFAEEEKTLREILLRYEVDGIYYSNETYSNPHKFEAQWIKYINKFRRLLTELREDLPFYISPFNSSAFKQSNRGKIKYWETFFKNVEFKKGDVFLLQDGFGALISEPTDRQCKRIYRLNLKIRNVCLKYSKAKFVLNVELFAQEGLASQRRVNKQISYANKLGDEIACFSFSHYYVH